MGINGSFVMSRLPPLRQDIKQNAANSRSVDPCLGPTTIDSFGTLCRPYRSQIL